MLQSTGQPSNKLSPQQQDKLLEMIAGTPAETQAILHGVIDPPSVRNFRYACSEFISGDPDVLRVKGKAITLSKKNEPVLVLGESGTGKELLAKILHGERSGLFVPVNVCAVTDTLFESELFGHAKGSFTGADKERMGLIKQADGGTLFLDEIGDMPIMLQAKLLRVIQSRTFRKVGSNYDEEVKCRIVAATHRNLLDMISKGQFRLDLYQRLQVFKLKIKPLRERLGDMELYLGKEFLQQCNVLTRYKDELTFSGNVRQLLNLKIKYDVFGNDDLELEDVL